MNQLPRLTENEIEYICSVIPEDHVIDYFTQNPRGFAKILPGFRPTAISRFNVGDLLFKNNNKHFVSSFIENHINIWLYQIQEHIDKCIQDGDDKDTAYIRTLSLSYFANNVELYFKLIEEEHSDTYVSLLSSAVKNTKKLLDEQKENLDEQEKLTKLVQSKDEEIERIQTELNTTKDFLEKSESKLTEYIVEINSLKQELIQADELLAHVNKKEQTIAALKEKVHTLEITNKELSAELSEVKTSQQQLEQQIKNEIKKHQTEQIIKQTTIVKPLRPIDLPEFKEFLEYNLENIGVSRQSEYWSLLNQYLSEVLFEGVPIIINRGTGVSLMKCVANALVGNMNVPTLTCNNDISSKEINLFLSRDSRVICLNEFLGNYNETELLTLLEKRKNKIIFLTLSFDRTLYYIPYEVFRYCRYLNLNRIQAFSLGADLTESPSKFEENEFDISKRNPDVRFSSLLEEILIEVGFPQSITAHESTSIHDEQSLCGKLAFAVLPYCTDVLNIYPFSVSQRLVKYAGSRGRCSYKKLFKDWFIK